MNLPDGDYKGCVYISAGSVSDENDFDYGRKQFIIELMPTAEKYKDESIILNRVMLPHWLANEPAPNDQEALDEWRGEIKIYLRQTNELLERCGVDTSEIDGTQFVQQIAQNNISRPIVSFTMKEGVPTIHNIISRENPEVSRADLESLPDGNDAPF